MALRLSYSPTYEGQRASGAGLRREAGVCAAERLDAVRTVPGRLIGTDINRLVCLLARAKNTIVGDGKLIPLITPYR